jgi:glycosyltransferase involved in cell wall biosynthesis
MTIEQQTQPSISVVITVHDQADVLEQNLPAFLTLPYEGSYEVIVVDDMSTDETPDVLKRLKAEYPKLYSTFLPASVVVNPSRKRLALSVGAKAAHHDYIVLADIRRQPVSADWLAGLADGEAALVFCNRKRDKVTHVVATELEDLSRIILKAERHSFRDYWGKWFRKQRGLYDAVGVRKEHVFDAIRLYDQRIRGLRLLGLRLRVWLGF